MSEWFNYGGIDSSAYGIVAFEKNTFGAPKREYSRFTIPGRDGDLFIDEKRYSNVNHSYACLIYDDVETNFRNFVNALHSKTGYQTLYDSIHRQSGKEEFYKAIYVNSSQVILDRERKMGKFTVEFSRKPQRYIFSGNYGYEVMNHQIVYNSYQFPAKPLIRIYGTGTLEVGSYSITVNYCDEYTDIDSELMEAYKEDVSCNDYIELLNNKFPLLEPGFTEFIRTDGITKVMLTPRWYIL